MPYGLRFEDACLYRQNPPSVLGFLGIVIVFSFALINTHKVLPLKKANNKGSYTEETIAAI